MIAELPVLPSTPSHSLLDAAEPCCLPGLCTYQPALLAKTLKYMDGLDMHGEDPSEALASPRSSSDWQGGGGDSAPGGSGLAHLGARVWDIQRVLGELGVTAGQADPVTVARRLCPWSTDGCVDGDGSADA